MTGVIMLSVPIFRRRAALHEGILLAIPLAADGRDEELWRGVRAGSVEAFVGVVRAHQGPLRRFATAMLGDACEGDDVAQRALLGLWEQRETTEVRGSLRAHLLARVKHLCLTGLRTSRRSERWVRHAAEEPRTPPPTPLDELARRDAQQALERLGGRIAALVDALDDDARTGIWMRFAGGASFDEIGEALARPPHAVRALVYRQLALLRKRVEEDDR